MVHAYAYLLALYLGDGYLVRARRNVWVLRIACADAWPGLRRECAATITRLFPYNQVGEVPRVGCQWIQSYSKHWPCLFPQHGEGRKHTRHIALEPWQSEIVQSHPKPFLRGLFHSDGCRISNWTTRTVAGEKKRYEYPRYLFVNMSADILGMCAWALDLLGIAYTRPKPTTISVARRQAVASLDAFIGPKY